MLVLSRRVGESVVVGADVVITVLEVRGEVIRLGVEAPRDVPVHRSEVLAAIVSAQRSGSPDHPDADATGATEGDATP